MPSLTRTLFVDSVPLNSAQNGSLSDPYLSIQAAVHAIPIPQTVAESDEEWTILIAPGDYDEDVVIKGPLRLSLIGLGAFRLGKYTATGSSAPKQTNIVAVAGSTARNVVWTYNQDLRISGGAAPHLVIGMVGATDVIRHGKPNANRISGSIIVQGNGWTNANIPNGGTAFLAITGTQVDAGITTSQSTPTRPAIDTIGSIAGFEAFSGTLVDRHFNSRFRGTIRAPLNGVDEATPAYVLVTASLSQYEQLIEVTQYGSIQQCAIGAGMMVARPPSLFKLGVPPGMVNSTFAGTFLFHADHQFEPNPAMPQPRSGAGSLLLDATTNTWFVRNKATLDGGATKRFLSGVSQTLYTETARTLIEGECGATLLANTTPGSFTVTLPSAAGNDDLTFTIRNIGTAGRVNVLPVTGERIDGETSYFVMIRAEATLWPTGITIVAHGGNWWVIAQVSGR
jgi:hypothetical protein